MSEPAAAPPTPIESWEVLDLLTSLVQKSLVVYEEDEQGQGRYRLLEPMRQYAQDRLLEAGETGALRDRHRDWFVELGERAESHLCQGAGTRAWLDRLEREHDNLRAALECCQASEEGREAALRLVGALTWYWLKRGHLAEAQQCMTDALTAGSGASVTARGKALYGAMWVAHLRHDGTTEAGLAAEGLALGREAGDRWLTAYSLFHSGTTQLEEGGPRRAEALYEEGLALAREVGDRQLITTLLQALAVAAEQRGDDNRARMLHQEALDRFREAEDSGGTGVQLGNLGRLAQRQGNAEEARALYHVSLALFRDVRDPIQIRDCLSLLADLALTQGDLATSRAHCEEAVALARELNDPAGLAWFISQLGDVACRQGEYERATALHQESLAIWQEREDKPGIAWAHHQLGIVAQRQGDYPTARARHAQSLSLWQELGHQHDVARGLEQLAAVAKAEGRPRKGARLCGAAAALREASGIPLSPLERVEHDQCAAALRAALGEVAFAAAWAEGRAMATEAAIAGALEEDTHA